MLLGVEWPIKSTLQRSEIMKETLAEFGVGDTGRVTGYFKGHGYKRYRSKLLAMGLIKGTEFTVNRVAPLGDPVEINLRGFSLSLRKDEATALIVEEVRK